MAITHVIVDGSNIATEGRTLPSLAQLDEAFSLAASRSGEVEPLHFAVNSKIADVKFALYRDFPDPVRKSGEELF